MTEGIMHTPPSTGQRGTSLNGEASSNSNYIQNDWQYTTQINDADNHHPSAASGGWEGDLPAASYCYPTATFEAPLIGTDWPDYGATAGDSTWIPSFDANEPTWPLSPTDTLSTNPWSPLPSPLSEAPSFILTQSPLPEAGGPSGSRETASEPGQTPGNSYNTPETTVSEPSTFPTPTLNSQSKPKTKPARPPPSSKRAAAIATEAPRPRTLKRHKSDTPSTIASTTSTTNNNIFNPNPIPANPKTTLGGVLPANVDPRQACEQIRRQAWDRCRAEAHEMAQRRTMLRGYEHGALEREMERLRVNLGVMRERQRELEAGEGGLGRNFDGMGRGGT